MYNTEMSERKNIFYCPSLMETIESGPFFKRIIIIIIFWVDKKEDSM